LPASLHPQTKWRKIAERCFSTNLGYYRFGVPSVIVALGMNCGFVGRIGTRFSTQSTQTSSSTSSSVSMRRCPSMNGDAVESISTLSTECRVRECVSSSISRLL
jgi:hypothetical protein